MSVQNTGTPGVRASVDGSRLTLTADRRTRAACEASFRLVVSDVVDGDPPASRTAEGRIQFQVIGTPSPPGEPRPYPRSDEVGTIKMSWAPPDDDGGAPILYYVVREEQTGATQRCDTNECVFRKLQEPAATTASGCRRVNRVGASDWSDLSRSARADTQPGRVQNIRMIGRGDGRSPSPGTSRRPRPRGSSTTPSPGSAGRPRRGRRQMSFPATGLNNNQQYVFTVKAQNQVGLLAARARRPSCSRSARRRRPAAPAVTDLESGANQTNLRIAWQAVLPEGPGPTVYTVSYTNGVTVGRRARAARSSRR